MADRLVVTELDFDTIKTNLKNFLKQQNTFVDYDFEGSGLNVLLDILAYNTHYHSYYLNMVANECFLDTALLRDSVVSHAKILGYTPHSKKSPRAIINFEVKSSNNTPGTLTLPRGFGFLSNQIDGRSYKFVVLDGQTVTKSNTSYYFENLDIHEGQLALYSFNYDEGSNPKQIFTIPDENVDIDTLDVTVSPSISNTSITTYIRNDNIDDSEMFSNIYYLQEHRDGKYQIYFGDDILGKKLDDGSVVNISYLITNSDSANKANNFVATISLTDSLNEQITNYIISPVSAASGGNDRETVDQIKFRAPLQYLSQNRLVTYNDYKLYILRNYLNLQSISVWGGEDENPPIYGKVFISLLPKQGYYISESEKERIIVDLLGPKSIVTIQSEIRDPEYLFINTTTNVQYDPRKTTLTVEGFKNAIRNSIITYRNNYLNKFDSRFAISKLQEAVDNTDVNSIVGSETNIRVCKKIIPSLGTVNNYSINFNVPLLQGSSKNKLTSNDFYVNDLAGISRRVSLEEVTKSYTGINSINIIDPGSGYTTPPTVTITGDGFGATAIATVSLGKIQSIQITNPGVDYNQAVVTISGNGFGASAIAIIDTKIGKLRTFYYNQNAERIVVNNNAGEINYDTGTILLTDLNIISIDSSDGLLRIESGIQTNIIQSNKNTILTIDETEDTSIIINLQQI